MLPLYDMLYRLRLNPETFYLSLVCLLKVTHVECTL